MTNEYDLGGENQDTICTDVLKAFAKVKSIKKLTMSIKANHDNLAFLSKLLKQWKHMSDISLYLTSIGGEKSIDLQDFFMQFSKLA